MNWKAAKTSAALCLLFLVFYNACNYITSLRHDVGTFYFSWERYIPFVPIFIVPYMSIDLFFVAAPFLASNDIELRMIRRRIASAILIACACFLIFPLRFAFERPHVSGALGVVFNNFRNLDKPFNQAPSLHMALRTILALVYVRHLSGLWKWSSRIWFSLIGFSTLLTYQHHVIDIVAGFALGAVCVHLFQETPLRMPIICNRKVGLYYLIVATILIAGAYPLHRWGLLLVWPAVSCMMVAAGYFGIGPGIYRKQAGLISFTGRLLLWPVLLAQRLSLMHYSRQCEPWNELAPNVWIGRKLNDAEAADAIDRGVSAVLDLTCESSECRPFLAAHYRHLPIMDLTAPTPGHILDALEFIHEHSSDGIVYIHCKAGYSRTGGIACAYLLSTGKANTVEEAIAHVRSVRPKIVIRREIITAIRGYTRAAHGAPRCHSP
ncbi:MAG TPA: phosphatase PAP2/dual specificity phosphatase family protein [Humisphaera sp.]|nr:phosphatase PAP2/dual specificity phosphatase family protein [Humisphaera sp.]